MQLILDSVLSLSSTSSSQSTPKPELEVILVGCKKQLTGNSDELSEPLYLVNILDGSSRKLPAFPYECKIKSITVEERAIYINSKVSSYRSSYPVRVQRPIFRYDLVSNSWELMLERCGPPLTDYVFEVDKWLILSWIQGADSHTGTYLSRYDLQNQKFVPNPDTWIRYRNPSFVVVDKMIYTLGGCSIMEGNGAVRSAQEEDAMSEASALDSDQSEGKIATVSTSRTIQREDEFVLAPTALTFVPSVQRLNPTTNEWTQLAPMLEIRERLLCCAYNGRIYVLDGKDHPVSPSPQVYHIAEDKWEWGPSLNRVYSHPATLVVVNNTLTFIDKSRFPVLQIERLLPGSDAWEVGDDVDVKSEYQIMDAQFFPGVAKVKSF